MTREYADLIGLGLQHRLEQIGQELVRLQELVVDLQKQAAKVEGVSLTPKKGSWTPERRKKFLLTLKRKQQEAEAKAKKKG